MGRVDTKRIGINDNNEADDTIKQNEISFDQAISIAAEETKVTDNTGKFVGLLSHEIVKEHHADK